MNLQNETGFAVLCDMNGKIKKVLFEGIDNKCILQDSSLFNVIDINSREKFINFRVALTMNKTIVDWQLNLSCHEHAQTMLLAGTISEENMLLVFGYSTIEINLICEKLKLIGYPNVDRISRLIHDNQKSNLEALQNSDSMYDELSSLNNELISLQRELAKKNAELDQRVKDRTSQLEAANLELEGFLYSVSHQLRSPLRGINGWSQALFEDYKAKLDEKGINYLERVQKESLLMASLLDDFQLFSRISRKEMKIEKVDLSKLAEQIIQNFKQQEPGREIEFICQPDLQDWGDEPLLELALENLLSNAYKFTEPIAQAKIQFGKTIINDLETYFIRDNGIGFNVDLAKNMFGAFFQFHDPEEFPGNGIGLTLVKRVVHKHGGQVWAESAINEGSTFYFTLFANETTY